MKKIFVSLTELSKKSHHISIAILIIGIISALAVNALPLISSWQPIKRPFIGLILFTILALYIAITKHAKSKPLLGGSVIVIAFVIFTFWLILMDSFSGSPLSGEDIVTIVRDESSGDEILVYSLSEIPDGFIASRIAVRISWLPFEQTILQIDKPFSATKLTNSGLEFSFGTKNLRYIYSEGQLRPMSKTKSH